MHFKTFFNILLCIASLSLISCNNTSKEAEKKHSKQSTIEQELTTDTNMLLGSWEDQSEAALHFTLFKDGTAQSDNMKTLLYKEWKVEDDQLFLVFESIGNKISSIDTVAYEIQQLDKEQMILKKDGISWKYKKLQPKEKTAVEENSKTLSGRLTLGHEANSFQPCGSDKVFWVRDQTNNLKDIYEQLTNEEQAYTPIFVEIEIIDKGKTKEGFPADYESVYEVIKVTQARKTQNNDCE